MYVNFKINNTTIEILFYINNEIWSNQVVGIIVTYQGCGERVAAFSSGVGVYFFHFRWSLSLF